MSNLILILIFVSALFLTRAIYVFFIGRKLVGYNYIRKPVRLNFLIGIAIVPLSIFWYQVSHSQMENSYSDQLQPEFLTGSYILQNNQGTITFYSPNTDSSKVTFNYTNGWQLDGYYNIRSSNLAATNSGTFLIYISGNQKQKKKTSPYEHTFNGRINLDTLILESIQEKAVITAIRQP